ncbi:MAG: tripartite tricarboxylate transporter TctB family protein [Salinarimonas sp.]
MLGPIEGRGGRIGFLALVVAYVFVVSRGGFTLTTFVFVLLASLLAGRRPVGRALAFAAVAALSGWLFFIVLLGTRFPRGPFEHLVSWLVASWT